jgi:hypothetical protein
MKKNRMQNNKNTSISKGIQDINEFSFARGFSQVQNKDLKTVRKELMEKLGLQTNPAFMQRMKGKIVPKVTEVRIIEEIFAKRGITDVWGEALEPIFTE